MRMRVWITKAPMIADVETRVGWCKLWDRTLEFGVQHARGLQTISRVMAHHGFGSQPCPLCEAGDLQVSVYHHLLDIHKHKFGLTDQDPITKLENLDVGFLARFRGLFF